MMTLRVTMKNVVYGVAHGLAARIHAQAAVFFMLTLTHLPVHGGSGYWISVTTMNQGKEYPRQRRRVTHVVSW